MDELRILTPADAECLETYLLSRPASTLFLRSNARQAGLVDEGQELQATYAGAFENGELVGVAAHCWNGMLLLAAERELAAVSRAALEASGRTLRGLLGPWNEVTGARRALGQDDRPTRMEQREDLFWLELDDLVVPERLARGEVEVRLTREEDLDLAISWRVEYSHEIFGSKRGAELDAQAAVDIRFLQRRGSQYLLFEEERPVAYTAFNAQTPDCVQVGGVWTPVERRGRGHARCAVAGSLLHAGGRGVTSAVLFTGEDNEPAQRAYRALGFERVGDYGIVFFA